MSKTISSTYTTGITFSTTASNPVTIESTGKDSANTGIVFSRAVYGEGGGTNSWTIHNCGTVIGSGTNTHNAIKFGKGGGPGPIAGPLPILAPIGVALACRYAPARVSHFDWGQRWPVPSFRPLIPAASRLPARAAIRSR
jgi:hypothetical protein